MINKYNIRLFFLILLIINSVNIQAQKLSEKDYANNLSTKIDTLELNYIEWACPCANWLPIKYLVDTKQNINELGDSCIFIEADNEQLVLPQNYRVGGNGKNKTIVIGSYYEDIGISRDYISPVGKLPEKAKMFRYIDIKIIKPYMIWNEEIKDYQVLQKEDKTKFD